MFDGTILEVLRYESNTVSSALVMWIGYALLIVKGDWYKGEQILNNEV